MIIVQRWTSLASYPSVTLAYEIYLINTKPGPTPVKV
jgi:hypothetical protein